MTRTRVALLTAGDPGRMTGGYLFHRRLAEAAPRFGVEMAFASIPAWPLPWALLSGPRWIGSPQLLAADVIVLDSIAAAPAAPWLGRLRAPIVGMLHQPPGGIDGGSLERRMRVPFDRWAYRQARILVVASDWLAAELVREGVAPSRLRVLPPGKDPSDAPLGRPGGTALARYRQDRRMVALCVASWLPRKGIRELLEAVALLPDDALTLHLVGETGSSRYARGIRRRLKAADLRHRVVVHGILAPKEVQELYRAADVFVLPSYEEPYGTVWGEAMAAGLPVVGWRAANLPYLMDDGREGLMAPSGDVRVLAGHLERLAGDRELRLRMGAAAAHRAEPRPAWEETAARFFAITRDAGDRWREHG